VWQKEKESWRKKLYARQIPSMPAESKCSKVYTKNMELKAFIHSLSSMPPNFTATHFNLCYTPETTQRNSVCFCLIWLKIVPNRSAIDRASKHDLCDVMIIKGVLNPNFLPFSFELNKKNRFFEINFDLGFRVLWPWKLKSKDIWIFFPLQLNDVIMRTS